MTEFPENPFKPGFGRNPAYRGTRPDVESVLGGLLRMLRGGTPDTQAAFLYGSRGNGKTVLLHWLHAEAEKDGASGKKIVLAELPPGRMTSTKTMVRRILRTTSRFGRWADRIEETVVNIPFLGSLRFTGAGPSRSPEEVLSKKRTPLLLTLDEAHETEPEVLGALLNAVQQAGRVRPVAAVFAGTPGLESALLGTRASFWGRGRKLRIGLLSKTSAREALARPFRDAGLGADDEAVAALAAAADNYPYFLQLYGEVAWSVVEASDGRTLLPEHVAPTVAAADGARRDYYNHRFREFSGAGRLPLARGVAEAFVASADTPADRSLPDAALREILAVHGDVDEAMQFLAAKGYVWQDRSGEHSWTPGIPSLMDYMIERIPPR